MADIEKVIKGFECCHVMVHDLGPDKTSCGTCPYKNVQTEEQIDLGGIECIATLHDDALALLKEQEHKDRMFHALEDDWKLLKELLKKQEAVEPDTDSEGTVSCGTCGTNVGYYPAGCSVPEKLCMYCPECGQAVKWT